MDVTTATKSIEDVAKLLGRPQSDGPNVHQRINSVREEVTYLQKQELTGNAPYKSAASQADLIRKVRTSLVKHGLTWMPHDVEVLHREIVKKETTKGIRYTYWTQAIFTYRFVNIDHPGQHVDVPIVMDCMDPEDKGCAKGSTMSDKFALLRALNIETGLDADFDHKDLDPEMEPERYALVQRIEALAEQLQPTDPRAAINAGLLFWGEKYSRRIVSLTAAPMPIMEDWVAMWERKLASDPSQGDTSVANEHPADPSGLFAPNEAISVEQVAQQRLAELAIYVIRGNPKVDAPAAQAAVVNLLGPDGLTLEDLGTDDGYKKALDLAKNTEDWSRFLRG